MNLFDSRYAITFGEVSVLHYGSQEIGEKAQSGFSVQDLREIKNKLEQQNKVECNFINLTQALPEGEREGNEAAVLHIPGLANVMLEQEDGAMKLYEEQQSISYDKKYYDARKKKTFNKRARFNIVFADEEQQASEDYQTYTVKAFKDLKLLNVIRAKIGEFFGAKAVNLNAEGNHYYAQGSGIGFHGDRERNIVICVCLGKKSILRYYWRKPHSSQNRFGPIDIQVKHGDIYIMSEKATGSDWQKRSKYRLVHAAGSKNYIGKV